VKCSKLIEKDGIWGWWGYMLVIPATQRQRQEDQKFQASLDEVIETLSQKQNMSKKPGGVPQEVEHLSGT
jgi:hypothetical protein